MSLSILPCFLGLRVLLAHLVLSRKYGIVPTISTYGIISRLVGNPIPCSILQWKMFSTAVLTYLLDDDAEVDA